MSLSLESIRLFHITSITNLDNICKRGSLLSKNLIGNHGINYQNVAHSGAQGSRSKKKVNDPPGGVIHDFVPFYFAPRSPMLCAIDRGKVDGCDLTQEDIIYFETTVSKVINGNEYVFYDCNATLNYSTCYSEVKDLDTIIDWNLLTEPPRLDGYCKYFHNIYEDIRRCDRSAKRHAEFLLKNEVKLSCINRIGVIDENKKNQVNGILRSNGLQLQVDIMRDWYFLGQ